MLNHFVHSQNKSNVTLVVNKLCTVKIVMEDDGFYIK
jgi:hypothetical protein